MYESVWQYSYRPHASNKGGLWRFCSVQVAFFWWSHLICNYSTFFVHNLIRFRNHGFSSFQSSFFYQWWYYKKDAIRNSIQDMTNDSTAHLPEYALLNISDWQCWSTTYLRITNALVNDIQRLSTITFYASYL